jgi:hypothetical protein
VKHFNLAELFSSLVGAGVRRANELGSDESATGVTTTIRLSPEARRFYEAQAEVFGGASLSAMVAMTLESVMRATKGEMDTLSQRNRRAVDLLRDRFAYVYQAHGVPLTTMADLLKPHGFSLSSLQDEAQFSNLLTDAVIDETADRFHVSRGWFLEQGPITGEGERWYKAPGNVCARIMELSRAGLRPEVICIRREAADFERAFAEGDNAPEEPIGLLIETHLVTATGNKFPTYEVWEFQRWNYQKCRLYYKALILWFEKARMERLLEWRGIELPRDIFRGLRGGELLPVEALKARKPGCAWYPDDYTDSPERSVCSKESVELSLVKETYQECNLDRFFG